MGSLSRAAPRLAGPQGSTLWEPGTCRAPKAYLTEEGAPAMSRGLGSLQRDIKEALTKVADNGYGRLGIAGLRQWLVARAGGDPELDTLRPAGERCLSHQGSA